MSVALDGLVITIPGVARGKGRPRFGNGRTYTDAATENAEAWVRACAVEQVGQPVIEGPLSVGVYIDVEIPASWSKRKREEALCGSLIPIGKPDADNTCKLLFDALNKIVWRDDAQIAGLTFVKRYADAPQTVITVRSL